MRSLNWEHGKEAGVVDSRVALYSSVKSGLIRGKERLRYCIERAHGGVFCPRSKGRRASILPRPLAEKVAQEIPATAPVVPTQASLFFAEAATVLGNSPGTATGFPTGEREVGSPDEIVIMVSVLEPALTAKTFLGSVSWVLAYKTSREAGVW